MLNKCEVSVFHHLHPWKNPGNFFLAGWLGGRGTLSHNFFIINSLSVGRFSGWPYATVIRRWGIYSQKLSVVLRAIPFHGGSPERVDSWVSCMCLIIFWGYSRYFYHIFALFPFIRHVFLEVKGSQIYMPIGAWLISSVCDSGKL